MTIMKLKDRTRTNFRSFFVESSIYDNGELTVTPNSSELAMELQRVIKARYPYRISDLVKVYGAIGHVPDDGDGEVLAYVQELKDYLKPHYLKFKEEFDMAINAGLITFHQVVSYFQPGDKVGALWDDDNLLAGEVVSVEDNRNMFNRAIEVTVKTIGCTNGKVQQNTMPLRVRFFDGAMKISELSVKKLTDNQLTKLTERGKVFQQITTNPSYVQYTGNIIRRSWYGNKTIRADGRIMVDPGNCAKMDPKAIEIYKYMQDRFSRDDEDRTSKFTIPDNLLWMCEPIVLGFSFRNKMWGEVNVADISPIEFRSDAINKLVLDPKRKKMVTALVEHSAGSFSDVVAEKGGGCIFLLHGEPGLGKTLTAEAVAEHLKRPLYSVSVGELGTHPEELEESLRNILDLASIWNAVVLLDEADIFLEARNEQDIVRNAMVGVFLRLLEYHQGVMFLTSNRVKNFDKAFHSRISVALKYPNADHSFRCKVWNNLLQAAGLTYLSGERFANYQINGRQIKNTIRLAQTLAKSEGRKVTEDDINHTVALANQFQADLIAG